MPDATLAHAPAPTDEQFDRVLDATADSFARQLLSPIMQAERVRCSGGLRSAVLVGPDYF
jgi:hypothetical protein